MHASCLVHPSWPVLPYLDKWLLCVCTKEQAIQGTSTIHIRIAVLGLVIDSGKKYFNIKTGYTIHRVQARLTQNATYPVTQCAAGIFIAANQVAMQMATSAVIPRFVKLQAFLRTAKCFCLSKRNMGSTLLKMQGLSNKKGLLKCNVPLERMTPWTITVE